MDERKEMDLEVEEEISVEVPEETDITLEDTPKGVFEIGEIPELRKANRKVFRMSDGTHKAVFYPEAVHVFNAETSEFDDVDHTLSQDEDCKHFRNEKNGFSAKFNSEESNDELFTIEKDSHSVVISVKRNKRLMNKGVVPSLKKAQHTGKMGTHHKDTLLFADIESGTDMEYTVNGNGVKENIIVKEKADVYRYSFILDCNNVVAEHIEDEKKVKFVDSTTGEEVFFIPAPFMVDAAGVVSNDVSYEVKHISENKYSFAVMADSEWINAEDRVLPVTIDPQINVSGTSQMSSFSWTNGNMTETASHIVGTIGEVATNANRMYMQFEMPDLPNNPRIKKAEMKLVQSASNIECGIHHKLGLFEVTEDIATGACTPAHSENLIDYEVMKDGADSVYTFDITSIADKITAGETDNGKLVLMMLDEDDSCGDNITICGSGDSSNAPTICITYESNYGVNNSYITHTHELGRLGQGTVDLQSGNLMFDAEDFAWAGNRMPVTLRHMYNSALASHQYTRNSNIQLNTADFSAMKIGNGWKLNVMQSIKAHTFMHEGVEYSGYVFIDETGAETYFKRSEKKDWNEESAVCYNLYESIDDSTTLYDPYKKELADGSETKLFDSAGRLIKITDEFGNHMDITFTSGRITSVTDGAGRDFGFAYDASNHLTSITAPDGTSIVYTYSGDYLYSITYPEGQKVVINNASNKPACIMLCDSEGKVFGNVIYQFKNGKVSYVLENGIKDGQTVTGMKNLFSYSAASRKTVVQTVEPADSEEGETEDKITNTVYTFDYDGNIIDEYMYSSEADKFGVTGETDVHSNSGVVSNINNLLLNHSFKTLDDWNGESGNDTNTRITSYAYESSAKFGKHVLRINSTNKECIDNGVCQDTITLPAGEYTFSAYMRVVSAYTGTDTPGAFIRVTKTDGTVLAESEHLSKYDSEFTRLMAPFVIEEAMSVRVHILTNGKGTAYADAVQLEKNAFANEYNLLVNGNFEHETEGWVTSAAGVTASDETFFNMSRSLKMVGDLANSRQAYQEIAVKTGRSTRETFTLSGWAKGYGITDREREGCPAPQFRLRAEVKYYDSYYKEYGTETYTADFSPCTDEWQMASVQFAKEKYRIIQHVRVYCDYSYNFGVAYFDDIQVVRNSIEQCLSIQDFIAGGDNETEVEEINVIEDMPSVFEELKDVFGNALTETTFTDGEFGTIYRSFEYSSDASNVGNDLITEKDARGNATEYTVDEETSRNEVVTDRCGNKTEYEYDAAGRTTKVTSKNFEGTELANVSYEYDVFNNLTEITRGDGMKYALAYNAFHNLESIGVDGMADPLVKYTYKNGSGRLKAVTYANGHTMKATYNNLGQMVAERWYDDADMLVAYYKYVYDGQGNIVRSIDFVANKEYTYTYEEGRIIRAAESDITVNASEIVTSKFLVNSILYTYDKEGTLTKKRIIPTSGTAQIVYYETTDDNTVVKFTAGGKQVTSHSKTDSFGRKVFDELQLGTGFVSRQFTYHTGKATDEHKENGKLKSSPTTQLVKEISFSDGRTLVYEYDAEERITKVTDTIVVDDEPVVTVTQYTYDALGQLLTETVNGVVVTEMTYDNYGNILTKNGKVYTYGDSVWKDSLTAFDGSAITYDAQGNPTTYLGHTLTWEKGRQLKSFDSNTYTYNANGIRTSKTVGGVKHTYTLDGTKILRETWGDNTLVPVYDNEDSVCGIIYNDTPYYFQKNLQGDIIAITDANGDIASRYSYDAWGVCTVEESDCGIGEVNPFRYRGYYFDTETELYYLQSRYYSSNIGRFINSDEPACLIVASGFILGNNLLCYSFNNPICHRDCNGFLLANIISGIIGALINVLIDYVTSALGYWVDHRFSLNGYRYNLWSWNTAVVAASGFASGLIISSKYSKWICAIGSGVISGVTNIINCVIKKKSFSWKDLLFDIGFGVLWGYLGGNGTGYSFWQRSIFRKGGYFVYKGCTYYASRSLQLIKPVVKEFVKNFAVYASTLIGEWFRKFIMEKA